MFRSELEVRQKQNRGMGTRAETSRQEDRFAGINKAGSGCFFLWISGMLTSMKPYGKVDVA